MPPTRTSAPAARLEFPGTATASAAASRESSIVVNTADMGGLSTGGDQVVQEWQADNGLWGSPIFWNGATPTLYVWSQGDSLKAYPFVQGLFTSTPSAAVPYRARRRRRLRGAGGLLQRKRAGHGHRVGDRPRCRPGKHHRLRNPLCLRRHERRQRTLGQRTKRRSRRLRQFREVLRADRRQRKSVCRHRQYTRCGHSLRPAGLGSYPGSPDRADRNLGRRADRVELDSNPIFGRIVQYLSLDSQRRRGFGALSDRTPGDIFCRYRRYCRRHVLLYGRRCQRGRPRPGIHRGQRFPVVNTGAVLGIDFEGGRHHSCESDGRR